VGLKKGEDGKGAFVRHGVFVWGWTGYINLERERGHICLLYATDGRDEEDGREIIMKKRPRIILELLLSGGETDMA